MREVLVFCGGKKKSADDAYCAAVEAAGLKAKIIFPCLFSSIKHLLEKTPGIVLSGGGDILPDFYNAGYRSETLSYVDEKRDELEIAAAEFAWKRGVPLLGICRGLQVINCALGGDLYQDIDSEYPPCGEPKLHQQRKRHIPPFCISPSKPTHKISMDRNTRIYEIIKRESISVNSTHHQAIKRLGKGLIISARSEENIAEVVEGNTESYLIAVQFHPERLWKKFASHRKIFDSFANAVMNHK